MKSKSASLPSASDPHSGGESVLRSPDQSPEGTTQRTFRSCRPFRARKWAREYALPTEVLTASAGTARAFTLVELIVSASLMSMILVSSYICLNAGMHSRKLVQQRSTTIQTGRVAINLIAADLRSATPLSEELEFIGMDRQLGNMEADNIDFATHRYTPTKRSEGDWAEVSYYISQDEKTGQNVLYRRRDATPDPEPMMGGSKEEIATGIRGLSFQFYDGFEWFEEWGDAEGKAQFMEFPDSNMSGMPEAVRIQLALDAEPAKPITNALNSVEGTHTNAAPPMIFETIVRLNLAGHRWGAGPTGSATRGGDDE